MSDSTSILVAELADTRKALREARDENTRLVAEVERIRDLTAEARAWCGRHAPGCKAQEAARAESPFSTAFVDDPRCTCYVLPLYRFEVGAASDNTAIRQPAHSRPEGT